MTRPTLDNQGRAADVQAREWNWPFICMLLGGWLIVALVIAGVWFGGWALAKAAPW